MYLKTTILCIYNFLILYRCLFGVFFFPLYPAPANLNSWIRPWFAGILIIKKNSCVIDQIHLLALYACLQLNSTLFQSSQRSVKLVLSGFLVTSFQYIYTIYKRISLFQLDFFYGSKISSLMKGNFIQKWGHKMSNNKLHFEFKKRIPKIQDFFPFTFKK